jgi:endoglucanase
MRKARGSLVLTLGSLLIASGVISGCGAKEEPAPGASAGTGGSTATGGSGGAGSGGAGGSTGTGGTSTPAAAKFTIVGAGQ